jgi:hypothetical protein
MSTVIQKWYDGHPDALVGDHELYLEGTDCGCCGVDFAPTETDKIVAKIEEMLAQMDAVNAAMRRLIDDV